MLRIGPSTTPTSQVLVESPCVRRSTPSPHPARNILLFSTQNEIINAQGFHRAPLPETARAVNSIAGREKGIDDEYAI
jgi:hypothetical protein